MATYSAVDGVPQDFHLVHLGARALGGAALVFVEMTSPTPEGRITPGCPGLWNDAQQAAFRRITDFVHGQSTAQIGLQLGHSGPKGSTQRGLGRHRRTAARRQLAPAGGQCGAYGPQNQTPRAMTRADMDAVTRCLCGLDTAGRRSRLRLAGAALRARLPAVQLHLPADQPAHRRLRWLDREPLPLSRSRCSRPCARSGRQGGR
jgi:hypothetical protein